MATITSAVGVGSGIDINGTVSQLTAAEGKPQLDAITAKQTTSQAKLSGLGTLKGALSAFQNAVTALNKSSAFDSQVITSSDEKVLTVKVDPGVVASSHTIKVNSLAKPQKSVSTTEFKSTDVVNAGTLVFNDGKGDPKFSVTITAGVNDTLAGVRDAINKAQGNSNVVASIINVDSKTNPGTTVAKLVLTSKTAGIANSFSVDASLGDARFTLNTDNSANYNTIAAGDTSVSIDAEKVAANPQRSVANKEFLPSDVVAPGILTFKGISGAELFSVDIKAGENDKLYAAMDAINNATGNNSVVASVINVESKVNPGTIISKLVFTSKQAGTDNQFTIDASQGDIQFNLDSSPANAQKSTFAAEFTSTDKVTPGKLSFKDSSGTVKFSVDTQASTTTTVKADGSPLDLDVNGDPILVDEFGVEIPTQVLSTQGNDSLEDLRDAINFSPENKLVVASIIKTDSTITPGTTVSKLVLTALNPDASGGFTVDGSAGDSRFTLDPTAVNPELPSTFVSTLTTATFETVAANNENDGGQTVTSASNVISDAIPGTTLTLVSEGSANINSKSDTSLVSKSISTFVDAYNKLNDTLKQLTTYVKPGDAGNGPLLGDSNVQTIISQIKQTINSPVSSSDINSLNKLGITFDKKGVLSLDSTKLNTALSSNLPAVTELFTSENGVATQLNKKVTQFLDSKGSLSTQQETLNKTLTQLTADKNAVNARLAETQKRLQAQFIAMDNAVSQFKNTGTFLTQFVASQTKTNN
jgi:flagellar hook-associated protein 2